MSKEYRDFRPTVFDGHLEIPWEPSEELERARAELERVENSVTEMQEEVGEVSYGLMDKLDSCRKAVEELEKLEDRNNWLVVPVGRTRDSGTLAESNFEAALGILGGESESCEVHRFGHWGPGWFEIIIVRPDRANEVHDIESRLEDYPVLDEEDMSRREWDAMLGDWDSYGRSDFEEEVLSCLESEASSLDGETDLEKELRIMHERNDFCPDAQMTYDMLGQEPPSPHERLRRRIEELEGKPSEWWDKLWQDANGEYWTKFSGTVFEISKAVGEVMARELYWEV